MSNGLNGSYIAEKAEAGELLNEQEAIYMLGDDIDQDSLNRLYAVANARSREYVGNEARIWGAIGVDTKPCTRGCKFCSLGAPWNRDFEGVELTDEEVLEYARQLVERNARWVVLRTTEDYGISKLASLGRKVRSILPADTGLVANTGELNLSKAEKLYEAGFTMVYHLVRLREGIDTGIDPEDRIKTLEAIKESPLGLAYLVEPIGVEHTAEELVCEAFRAKHYGAQLTGAMARVPVPGTPLAEYGPLPEERLIRVVAMTRLINGPEVKYICVHPPTLGALHAGANIMVVEAGAVPREKITSACCCHRDFAFDTVFPLFEQAGFKTVYSRAD